MARQINPTSIETGFTDCKLCLQRNTNRKRISSKLIQVDKLTYVDGFLKICKRIVILNGLTFR